MTSSSPRYRVVNFSDVHLFHRYNPAGDIASNIKRMLSDPIIQSSTDMLCCVGDLFDTAGTLHSEELGEVMNLCSWLLLYCKTNNIVFRVVEGTPRHDWQQSELFNHIREIMGEQLEGLDFRYVKGMEFEHVEKLGIDVIYVQDAYRTTARETQDEVAELMSRLGKSKVDHFFLHGEFVYQSKGLSPGEVAFDEEFFLSRCKSYIAIGHYHVHSSYDRIIAQGSTDRTAHGEEGPKGMVVWDVYPQDHTQDTWFFYENTNARPFVTANVCGMEYEQAARFIDKLAKKIASRSPRSVGKYQGSLRVKVYSTDSHKELLQYLKVKYPEILFTVENETVKQKAAKEVAQAKSQPTFFSIDPTNLLPLMQARAAIKEQPADIQALIDKKLKGAMNV